MPVGRTRMFTLSLQNFATINNFLYCVLIKSGHFIFLQIITFSDSLTVYGKYNLNFNNNIKKVFEMPKSRKSTLLVVKRDTLQ
jgi:hypothetical protein